MKKILFLLLILLLGFGGYILYTNLSGIPKLKITAPPVDGAANSEIIKIFSKLLNISKSDITISSGQASRLKILEINTNKTCEEITALLENF